MIQMLIIADDFTGALDTGVRFAESGASVCVTQDRNIRFSDVSDKTTVLVVDTESRHISSEDAYERVYRLCLQAKAAKIKYIYKKTDSVLRGNIGSELSAVLAAEEKDRLHFVPAFPKMGRTTVNGIHCVGGVPVSETSFGKDPFDPLRTADIGELIHMQSKVGVLNVHDIDRIERCVTDSKEKKNVVVYDAAEEVDMIKIASKLSLNDDVNLFAGCAGFAGYLAERLSEELSAGDEAGKIKPFTVKKLLVICGSMNPVTLAQLDHAEKRGFLRIRPDTRMKLEKGYQDTDEGRDRIEDIVEYCRNNDRVIIDANDPGGSTSEYAKSIGIDKETERSRISNSLGRIAKAVIDNVDDVMLFVTGGDTVIGFMDSIGEQKLTPMTELSDGVALSGFEYGRKKYHIITKSGGFGNEKLITDLADRLITR